jgi:hypothetical protein
LLVELWEVMGCPRDLERLLVTFPFLKIASFSRRTGDEASA